MKNLPQYIKEIFYKTIDNPNSITEFEQWLYSDSCLERYLSPNDYLDLISLDFTNKHVKHELCKQLKKHVDLGEFETSKMLQLLYAAKQRNEQLPFILIRFYDLYCRGYYFLEDLGFRFGLHIKVPMLENTTADTWEELTLQQQEELLIGVTQDLEKYIARVITWLESKQLILTGQQTELGHYQYEDLRSEEDKKSSMGS